MSVTVEVSYKSPDDRLTFEYNLCEEESRASTRSPRVRTEREEGASRFAVDVPRASWPYLQELVSVPGSRPSEETEGSDSGSTEGGSSPLADRESNFLSYIACSLEEYRRRGQIGTHKVYANVYRKFSRYIREEQELETLPFELIDVPLIRGFKTFLTEVCGNGSNTINQAVRILRTFLNKAIGEGLFPLEKDPFPHIKRGREKVPDKKRLSIEQIRAIEELDLSDNAMRNDVRNWFLFAFYGGAMRFGDVATLKNEEVFREGEEWHLDYEMEKTGTRAGNLLPPPAVELLRRYYDPSGDPDDFVFNVLEGYDVSTTEKRWMAIKSRNAVANRHLKKIQKAAGIGITLTFHLARHSFADLLRREDWNIYDISKLLGHASIATTERYLASFDRESLNEKIGDLF